MLIIKVIIVIIGIFLCQIFKIVRDFPADQSPSAAKTSVSNVDIFELKDVSMESNSHLNPLGLSDCKFTPPVIEFTEQDPLGKSNVQTNYANLLTRDYNDPSQMTALTRSLGEQANGLKVQKERLYALERISQAIKIKTSKQIVFCVLDAMVTTLSFDEINMALSDLEMDSVQSLVDFMKIYDQVTSPDGIDTSRDFNVNREENGWNVVAVIIKVIMCQNQQALEDVARRCINVLVTEAKGDI